MSMLPPGYPYPSPAVGQWPSIAPNAASALQQSFAYPGSFPLVRPSTSAPLGAPLHHPSTSPWSSLQLPFASHPAATIPTMPAMNPHQLSAPHQLVSGPSMAAGLAAPPPFMWDARFLPQPVPSSSYPQSMLSASFGGPTASANSTGGISVHPTGTPLQHLQQQQVVAAMVSPDSASAAAAAAASAVAAFSARQQSTSQLSGYLAERHNGFSQAQAMGASPSSSGAGFPYHHPAAAAAPATSAPSVHHTLSAFNAPAQAPVLVPPPPRPTPPPPQPPPAAPALASIRSTLGPVAYSDVRSLMLQQQSTYVQQLFELHKLCQLQQLLTVEVNESAATMDNASNATAAAAAAADAGTAAAVTQMQLLSHAPSATNQQAQDTTRPSSRPDSENSVPCQTGGGGAMAAAGAADAQPSVSSLSDDARPAAPQPEQQAQQRHLGLTNMGNLPKAIRKVIDGGALRFPHLATQSRSGMSVGPGSVAGVVRPLPLYLIPCEPSGGDARPAHSIQATVQQQLLDVEHHSADQEATTTAGAAAKLWAATTKRHKDAGKPALLRRASEELLGLVGGTWRYAPPAQKARTDVAPGQALQQRRQQQQQQSGLQQQQQQQQPAASAPNAPGGYSEPLPHKARLIRLQSEHSPRRQRPAASDTSQERPPTLATSSPSPSGDRKRQSSPGSETSGRPAPSPPLGPAPGGVKSSVDPGRRPAASGSAKDTGSAYALLLHPAAPVPAPMPVPAPAAAAAPLSSSMLSNAAAVPPLHAMPPLFVPHVCQPQSLAPPVDLQAAWFAQHFPKSVAAAKQQQQQQQSNSQAAAMGMLARTPPHMSQMPPVFELEPGARADVTAQRASASHAGAPAVRWWQDAGLGYGGAAVSAPQASAGEVRLDPRAGQSGGAGPACSGYDGGPSSSKKVKGPEYRSQQASRSYCDEMRHESTGPAVAAPGPVAFECEGADAAGGAAAGFQRFKRHTGRKQQSKHASNRITANASHGNKSNCSGGGSGSESVADQPGSPRSKKHTQTAESGGDACKKARAAGATPEPAAGAGTDAACKKARSAAGILLSLSGMSG